MKRSVVIGSAVLAFCAVAVLILRRNENSDLVTNWESPEGLVLTLRANNQFELGSDQRVDFAGQWDVSGETLRLQILTIGGEPIDQALPDKLPENPTAVETLKKQIGNMSLKIAADRKSITWYSNGQQTVFTRSDLVRSINLADPVRFSSKSSSRNGGARGHGVLPHGEWL